MLMKIFGPKRDEAAGKWRRLQNEQLYDLYSSPDIIRVIKSRRVAWPGMWRVRDTGEMHTEFGSGDPREGDHLQHLGVDERVIFK
jgi:hypothetical protein